MKAKLIRQINKALNALCASRYDCIPTSGISAILNPLGLALEDGIYCGAAGEFLEPIGQNIHLRLSWYRLESGRYEIVAYAC